MKVFVTGTRGIPQLLGGVETHCENIYPLLSEKGVDVTVIARSPYVKKDIKTYKGVKIKKIFAPRKASIEAISHTLLTAIYSRFCGAQIVHVHSIGPGLIVPFLKLIGLKVVFTHHGSDYERKKWGRLAKTALRLGEKLALKYADEVIVISKHIQKNMEIKYNRKDTHLIHNGVPLQPTGAGNQNQFLCELGLEPNKYIVAVGRFVEEKGFHDLITAYRKINASEKLVIVGDSDHPSFYSEKLKEDASNTAGVLLTGFLKGDKLKAVFSNSRLFVMPSYHEGLPIALLEAMSFGLPILASDIPANIEVNLPNSSYFKTGDILSLSESLSSALSAPFSKINYSDLLKLYDWEAISQKTLLVYKKALDTPALSPRD